MKLDVVRDSNFLWVFRQMKLDQLKPIVDDLNRFEEQQIEAEGRISQVQISFRRYMMDLFWFLLRLHVNTFNISVECRDSRV